MKLRKSSSRRQSSHETCLWTRRWQESCKLANITPRAHAHAMYITHAHSMVLDRCSMHILSFSCLMSCVGALSLLFRERPISAVLGTQSLRHPAAAVRHGHLACSIVPNALRTHATSHAAGVHVERAQDGLHPVSGLAEACQAGTGA